VLSSSDEGRESDVAAHITVKYRYFALGWGEKGKRRGSGSCSRREAQHASYSAARREIDAPPFNGHVEPTVMSANCLAGGSGGRQSYRGAPRRPSNQTQYAAAKAARRRRKHSRRCQRANVPVMKVLPRSKQAFGSSMPIAA